MTKWICDKKGCVCAPCRCEMQGSFEPVYCILKDDKTFPKWEMYDTETKYEHVERRMEQKPETELPKLTAEVFDRPDCPEWATCAFVEKDGNAFYSSALHMATSDKGDCWGGADFQDENLFLRIEGKWDATDWKNSLIERPAKLPEWVEIGGYVYSPRNGYGKIISGSVKSCYIEFDGGAGDFQAENFSLLFLQARLRPYNAEEMRGLVGKVLEWGNNSELVISYNEAEVEVYVDRMWCNAEYLMNNEYTIDGNPCGKLEHLEDGEWVE